MASRFSHVAGGEGIRSSFSGGQHEKAIGDKTDSLGIASKFGILTQTVIHSPLVNQILVARFRQSTVNDDVAFIGNDFVQIKELHQDGFLYDVIRKDGFESRIRNAQVVGSLREFEKEFESSSDVEESIHLDLTRQSSLHIKKKLPPQFLALQLYSGVLIFIGILVDGQGKMKWISSRHKIAKSAHNLQAGMHFVVDSSAQYLAVGCSEAILTILSLFSRRSLEKKYEISNQLHFVEKEYQVFTDGAILKMDFLRPSSTEQVDTYLIVITSIKGKTRVILYYWEVCINPTIIYSSQPKRHLLHEQRKLPLLLIPLFVKSSFMLVYDSFLDVYQGSLEGNLIAKEYELSFQPPLQFFHGQTIPLWVTWARPPRLPSHRISKDDIYLIREDGLISYIEVDVDAEGLISSDVKIAELALSCGTAVACLNYEGVDLKKTGGDLIIIGGDSSNSGTYMILPRQSAEPCEPIINWYPAQDFVTTNSYQEYGLLGAGSIQKVESRIPCPDQIFTCSGKGKSGVITEHRHGIEAKIGLSLKYNSTIIQSWVFHEMVSNDPNQSNRILFLLALGDSSAVLHLKNDGSEISELGDDSTKFDLRFNTINAAQRNNRIVQVTEKSIMISEDHTEQIYNAYELLMVNLDHGIVDHGEIIHNAVIKDNFVLFTTSVQNVTYIQLLAFGKFQSELGLKDPGLALLNARICSLGKFTSHITCLTTCEIDSLHYALLNEWDGECNTLIFLPFNNESRKILRVTDEASQDFQMEAIISISTQNLNAKDLLIICGSRDGLLFTFQLQGCAFYMKLSRYDRIGATSVYITKDEYSIYGYFVICDFNLYGLIPKSLYEAHSRNDIESFTIHRFWITDAKNPGLIQPDIFSVANQPVFRSDKRNRDFLISTKSDLILASLCSKPEAIPRQIKLGGTPTRLFYSNSLEVIIVGMLMNGKSTLKFIDPSSGKDLSLAIDHHTKEPVEFVSGLGHFNERIFRLFEWTYIKDERQWNFIVISTSQGRVLIISVDAKVLNSQKLRKSLSLEQRKTRKRSKIAYYTRYKFRESKPAYSVVGYPDGLLWCAGNKLFCDALSLVDKRFKRSAQYELPSPATNLIYEDGMIYALTMSHSLEILKLIKNNSGVVQIIRTHGDQVTRPTLSHSIFKSEFENLVHLVSDKQGKVVGLLSTKNAIMDTLETLFEAQVPESIIKFRYGRCRPKWDLQWALDKSKCRDSLSLFNNHNFEKQLGIENCDILGLTITGSLFHFKVLDIASWRFLKFINDLAIKSPLICEFALEKINHVDPLQFENDAYILKQINGDVLLRCLKENMIEGILGIDVAYPKSNALFARLYELLQELHGDSLLKDAALNFYIKQTYADLDYFLRPIF
ncbi:putative thermotolerance protein [Erysiphe neolycopersici]|uniref:Putative thermotolerance protein n=1 Tax=Erysiphe neolycopersici TaxID=212602 RepID=A0A420I5C9_9PEZI|nr:putative thermotolerance protein [Erysiphe neolycopersici]